MGTTEIVARFFAELSPGQVPERVRHEARRIVLDTAGCLIGGRACEVAPVADALARALGGEGGRGATLLGQGDAPLLAAIYANARLANALDFDETFPVGAHFGVGAVAAAMAMAQDRNVSGADFLNGVICGYELGARVASYIGPMVEVRDGKVAGFAKVWGVAAPVVAAAAGAAAKIAGLDADRFRQALGHALANAPLPAGALWSGAVDLPNSKYCDAGWCAMAGAFGVLAVEAGSTSFDNVLDGPHGLARMCGVESFDEALLTRDLGERWLLEDVTYKLWPTCRFTHHALSSLARILTDEGITADEITQITIETGPLAASPRFTKPRPATFASRCFSYPHMVAALVLGVPPGPAWLTPELARDPRILAIADKVRVVPHARGGDFVHTMENNQIRTMPGGARVKTPRGEFAAENDYALGDPWHAQTRVSDADLAGKFALMSGGSDAVVARAIGKIMSIDEQPSVQDMILSLDHIARETARARAA